MKKFFLFLLTALLFAAPALAALKAGAKAPVFTAVAASGGKISLASYRDKEGVVLYFWDAGFDVCLSELESLNSRYKAYVGKGVRIISVNINPSTFKKARHYVAAHHISIPLILDASGKISRLYDVQGIAPSLYLIGKGGEIAYQEQGSFSVEKDLDPRIARFSPKGSAARSGLSDIPGEKDENGGTVFAIPDTPFQMTFPAGWKMKTGRKKKANLVFVYPGEGDSWRWIFIRVEKNIHEPPPLLMVQYMMDVHRKLGNVVDLAKPGPMEGFPQALRYAYAFTNADSMEIARLAVLRPMLFSHKGVWFIYTAPAAKFKAHDNEIHDFIASVRRRSGF